jgi:transitional endoplasmic reticulum ATPase
MAGLQRLESTGLEADYLPLLQLWMLRALVRCNGAADFVRDVRFSDMPLARLLGYTDADMRRYSKAWAFESLEARLFALEARAPAVPARSAVHRNIVRLGAHLGLNAVEQDILHLTALQRLQTELKEALDGAGELSRATVCRLFAEVLGHPVRDVQAALDERAKLARSALLTIDRANTYTFGHKVDLLEGLAEDLMLEHDNLQGLFGHSVVPSPPPRLTMHGFPHLGEDIAILQGYMDAATRLQQPGVNVLIHGRPGTGKTEFVRALAHHLGTPLFEIPTEQASGKPRAGHARFDAYRFAQSLLSVEDRNVLLFDEVEDVFCDASAYHLDRGNSSGVKGWINQSLERNAIPTFWVTNSLQAMDPAYLRRFDYVLHMDVPPASVRRRLIDQQMGDLPVSEHWRQRAARHDDMAPGVVERAAKVGILVCDVLPDAMPEQVLTRVMNNTLKALGASPLDPGLEDLPIAYRVDYLNADCNLERLRDGLGRVGEGRLCLYGPPGTGKTAFGRHLAAALDRPLLVKRSSDILSPYVGVAEANIARMFAEAKAEGAVLLLDEADGLLREREGAQRSWEVTQVNEMLTQMECFKGIFIASTNLMGSLDAAALRRFDARIRLDYLKADQAWQMFQELARSLEVDRPLPAAARSDVARLVALTPGDFAATARRCRLDQPADGTELLARLRALCEGKKGVVPRAIGFV